MFGNKQCGRNDVGKIYIMWGMLFLVSVIAFIVMSYRESKVTRPEESVTDPMFRQSRPMEKGRSSPRP